MSDTCKSTIRFAIIDGLAKSSHISRITVENADRMARDIMDTLFNPAIIWAVKEYSKRIEEE